MLEKQVGPLSLLLYFDEAQAGNIVSPDLTKKLLLGYVFIAVTGGWKEVVVLVLDNFGMEAGLACSVPGSVPFWFRLDENHLCHR